MLFKQLALITAVNSIILGHKTSKTPGEIYNEEYLRNLDIPLYHGGGTHHMRSGPIYDYDNNILERYFGTRGAWISVCVAEESDLQQIDLVQLRENSETGEF